MVWVGICDQSFNAEIFETSCDSRSFHNKHGSVICAKI